MPFGRADGERAAGANDFSNCAEKLEEDHAFDLRFSPSECIAAKVGEADEWK